MYPELPRRLALEVSKYYYAGKALLCIEGSTHRDVIIPGKGAMIGLTPKPALQSKVRHPRFTWFDERLNLTVEAHGDGTLSDIIAAEPTLHGVNVMRAEWRMYATKKQVMPSAQRTFPGYVLQIDDSATPDEVATIIVEQGPESTLVQACPLDLLAVARVTMEQAGSCSWLFPLIATGVPYHHNSTGRLVAVYPLILQQGESIVAATISLAGRDVGTQEGNAQAETHRFRAGSKFLAIDARPH